jgi:hypothetical protein
MNGPGPPAICRDLEAEPSGVVIGIRKEHRNEPDLGAEEPRRAVSDRPSGEPRSGGGRKRRFCPGDAPVGTCIKVSADRERDASILARSVPVDTPAVFRVGEGDRAGKRRNAE